MADKKIPVLNYTPEMTAALVAGYKAEPTKATVDAFAAKFGKTTKSIVAKLSREGVYKKAEPKAKDGSPVVHKDAMVGMIATAMGVTEEKLDGLEKAPKNALKLIFAALTAKAAEAEAEGVKAEGVEGAESDADAEAFAAKVDALFGTEGNAE